jgi:hypothetical protein
MKGFCGIASSYRVSAVGFNVLLDFGNAQVTLPLEAGQVLDGD